MLMKIECPRLTDRAVSPQLKSELFRLVDQINMVLTEADSKLKEMEDKLKEMEDKLNEKNAQ